MEKGYIHIYTGNGKGKTTSSIGLAIRAVGSSKKVFFGQFMKQGDYSEIKILKERFPEITIKQFGNNKFVYDYKPTDIQIEQAKEGFEYIKDVIINGDYDIVILDEICVVIFLEMIDVDEFIEVVKNKKESMELVLTGRYAHDKLVDIADLVSEIKEVKHYFNENVRARVGIEF